jgi:TolB-like protein
LLFVCIPLLAATAWPAPAQAQSRRAAVVRLQFSENVPEASREALVAKLFEGLAASDFQAFAGSVVSRVLRKDAALESCQDDACYRSIAKRLDVEFLVAGSIRAERRNYQVELELISGRSGRPLARKTDRCELCGLKEVGEKLSDMVGGLSGAAVVDVPATGRLEVETFPPGASVAVDDSPKGQAPLRLDLPAGPHRVSLTHAGYAPIERRIESEAGNAQTLSVSMSPIGATSASPTSPRTELRTLAWIGVLGGAVAVVTGAIFMFYDGRVEGCAKEDGAGACLKESQYDLKLQAGLGFGVGLGLAAAGGVLFYLSPAPAAGGARTASAWTAGVGGRF